MEPTAVIKRRLLDSPNGAAGSLGRQHSPCCAARSRPDTDNAHPTYEIGARIHAHPAPASRSVRFSAAAAHGITDVPSTKHHSPSVYWKPPAVASCPFVAPRPSKIFASPPSRARRPVPSPRDFHEIYRRRPLACSTRSAFSWGVGRRCYLHRIPRFRHGRATDTGLGGTALLAHPRKT